MRHLRRLKFAYYILRYLGPRVVWLRGQVYLDKALGRTRRRFRPRAWEELDLARLCVGATPTEPDAYARFKREQALPFFFPLGEVPALPATVRDNPQPRQPGLEERLSLLREGRCVYFFDKPSPEPVDWHVNPFDNAASDPTKSWAEIPDYLPGQGDPRMLWEPARAAWALDLAGRGRSATRRTNWRGFTGTGWIPGCRRARRGAGFSGSVASAARPPRRR